MNLSAWFAGLWAPAVAFAREGLSGVVFERPWLLLLLVPVALSAAVVVVRDRRARPVLSFARGHAAVRLPAGRGHVALVASRVALLCAAVLVVLGAARPRVVGAPDPGSSEGIDIVVALDVSGSMRAADFRPKDRLFVAKQVIEQYLLSRKSDRVGLVVFAGEAFTQAPLTHDKALLAEILEGVRTGVITDGTAIGDGLGIAVARLEGSKAQSKVVILVTDGDNNAGFLAPESAATLAKDSGIKVFPILVGRGGSVPFPDGTDIFGAPRYVSREMPVNPALLQQIATTTGGNYFAAQDPKALAQSFQRILDALDKSLLDGAPPARRRIDLHPFLLTPAALLLALALSLSFSRASVLP